MISRVISSTHDTTQHDTTILRIRPGLVDALTNVAQEAFINQMHFLMPNKQHKSTYIDWQGYD